MTHPPFAVFSLPRSRSAWLAHWLAEASDATVGHDTAIEADTVDDWLAGIARGLRGTCETGAVEAWPILRRAIPACRIAAVRRDVGEVADSLRRFGFEPPMDDLRRRDAALDALAAEPDVLSLDWRELADPRACARLQEHCLGGPFHWPIWERMDPINIQVLAPGRMARLAERAAPIARLKAELAERLASPRPFASVGEEKWPDIGDECEAMGAVHHAEATEGMEGPYKLNRGMIRAMDDAGLWRVFAARVDGVLAGYCCWSHETNPEADAPKTMAHGPFYVDPAHARLRLGSRLLDASRAKFRAEGYRAMKLHHTTRGRGARAGRLYERMGAVEFQREYLLGI